MNKEIEIPEGYEARIEGNKVILEPKESEDEKIRKDIIAFLQSMNSHCNPTQDWDLKNRWLPYLERQKENIVEWSAYDKATLEYIIEDIKSLLDDETEEEAKDTFERELKLLRAINDSVKLSNYTNPAELQKEQKPSIPEDIAAAYQMGLAEGRKDQRSTEWSEEDEKMLELLIAIIEVNHPNGHFKTTPAGSIDVESVTSEEVVSWLKSLRPSWKPSKEQISALERAIVKMHTPNDIGLLAGLRDSLKKL